MRAYKDSFSVTINIADEATLNVERLMDDNKFRLTLVLTKIANISGYVDIAPSKTYSPIGHGIIIDTVDRNLVFYLYLSYDTVTLRWFDTDIGAFVAVAGCYNCSLIKGLFE